MKISKLEFQINSACFAARLS